MDKDNVKKMNTFFRMVEFFLECIAISALCLAYFKDNIKFYTNIGSGGIIILGISAALLLVALFFSHYKNYITEKRLEEEIEKEEE